MSEWLEQLKAGDEVIVSGSRYHYDHVATVKKLTASQIVLEGGSRFRRDSGSRIPYSVWDNTRIEEATPERKDEVRRVARRGKMVQVLSNVVWQECSDEQLERILEVIKPAT